MVPGQQHDRLGAVRQGVHKVDAHIIRSATFDDVQAVQGRVQVQVVVPFGSNTVIRVSDLDL